MSIFYPMHDYLTVKKGVCLHSILGSHMVVSSGTAEMSDHLDQKNCSIENNNLAMDFR